MMGTRVVAAAIVAATATAVGASDRWTGPCTFGALDFDGKVDPIVLEGVTASAERGLLDVIQGTGVPCQVVSRIRLREAIRAVRPPTEDPSFPSLFRQILADRFVVGTVDRREQQLVLRIQLLDAQGRVIDAAESTAGTPEQLEARSHELAGSLVRRCLQGLFAARASVSSEVDGAQVRIDGQWMSTPAEVFVFPGQTVTLLAQGVEYEVSASDILRLKASGGALVTLRDHKGRGTFVKIATTVLLTAGAAVGAAALGKVEQDPGGRTPAEQRAGNALIGALAGLLGSLVIAPPIGNAFAKPTVDVQPRPGPTLGYGPGGVEFSAPGVSVALGPTGLSGYFY